MILCKSSVLLEDEHYSQILHLTWKLLLDRNEELSSTAGKTLLSSLQLRSVVSSPSHDDHLDRNASGAPDRSIVSTGNDESVGVDSLRIDFEISSFVAISIAFPDAIGRRSSVDRQSKTKFFDRSIRNVSQILPPSIEFVLPSPLLGLGNLQTVDPPWVSAVKTRVQQVALNQEEVVRRNVSMERKTPFVLEIGHHGEQIAAETSTRINSFGPVNRTDQQTCRARELRVDRRLDFIRCVLRVARASVEGRGR